MNAYKTQFNNNNNYNTKSDSNIKRFNRGWYDVESDTYKRPEAISTEITSHAVQKMKEKGE